MEMERIRKDSPFEFEHPLEKVKGSKICYNNIRGWNAHIAHFLSDKLFTRHSSVLCFTETKKGSSELCDISDHQTGWKSIHHPTASHGIAICYDESRVVINSLNIPDQRFFSQMELMSSLWLFFCIDHPLQTNNRYIILLMNSPINLVYWI